MIKILNFAPKILLPVLLAVCALSALGEEVTFSTTGLFCAGSGPCVAGSPSLTIGTNPQETYLFQVPVSTSVPIGTPDVALIKIGISVIGANPRPGTGSFTIDITQTAPAAGSKDFTGALSGNFAIGSAGATITFGQNSVDIAGVLYTLNSPSFKLPLIGPPTSVVPILTDITPNPEPSFFAVTGGVLACLALIAYRRRRSLGMTPQATYSSDLSGPPDPL